MVEESEEGKSRSSQPFDRDKEIVEPEDWIGDDAEIIEKDRPERLRNILENATGLRDAKDSLQRFPIQEKGGELRTLVADGPNRVRRGERFLVIASVTTSTNPQSGVSTQLGRLLLPDGGRDVHLELVLQGPLECRSNAKFILRVYPASDSSQAVFDVVATDVGRGRIILRSYVDEQYLGEVSWSVEIVNVAVNAVATRLRADIEVRQASERSATLEINRDDGGGQTRYHFRLRGPRIGDCLPQSVSFTEDLQQINKGLLVKLDAIAQGKSPYGASVVEKILQGTGTDLWMRLIPETMRRKLREHAVEIEQLTILSTDDPIPWELLFAGTADDRGLGFLCESWLVSRRIYGQAPQLRIGIGETLLVLPKNPPRGALSEIETVHKLFGGRTIDTLASLLTELDNPKFGLLHFAAHNKVDFQLPAASRVALDQPFEESILAAYAGKLRERAPLIFLNACSSAAQTMLWTGTSSWASRFLTAGAGAFLGTLWEIRDSSAREFAGFFYERLKQGSNVGSAFQGARRSICRAGDPTRLAYTLFGDPDAQLASEAC